MPITKHHFGARISGSCISGRFWREERGAQWPALPESLRLGREIRSRGVQVKEEHRCKASGYSIDALMTLEDGKRVAVEVDGPFHFVGRSQQPTGATQLKHRQLRHFGWRLESVHYLEWRTQLGVALSKILTAG